AAGSGEAIAQGPRALGDSGAFAGRDYEETFAFGIIDNIHGDHALTCIRDDVSSKLRNGSGDQGGVAQRESEIGGQGAAFLTGYDDVTLGDDPHLAFGLHQRGS